MKKIIMLALLALFTSYSYAQLHGFVKAGFNLSNYMHLDGSKAKVGYKFGAGAEYSLDDMWAIQSALYFTTKGVIDDATNIKANSQQNYLELPVLGVVKMEFTDFTRINFGLGPYFAYGIGGTLRRENKTTGEITKVNPFDDFGMRKFDTGLAINFTFEHFKIMAGVDCSIGLLHVREDMKFENSSISLFLGYKF